MGSPPAHAQRHKSSDHKLLQIKAGAQRTRTRSSTYSPVLLLLQQPLAVCAACSASTL